MAKSFYGALASANTFLFISKRNPRTVVSRKKPLEIWLFASKNTFYQHFGLKNQKHSDITLPFSKNAIQLNFGHFRAILRYSFGLISFQYLMWVYSRFSTVYSIIPCFFAKQKEPR